MSNPNCTCNSSVSEPFRIFFPLGMLFGLAGVGGSLLGSVWNEAVDADVLLLAFSMLMLVAAFPMWRRLQRQV